MNKYTTYTDKENTIIQINEMSIGVSVRCYKKDTLQYSYLLTPSEHVNYIQHIVYIGFTRKA